MYHVITIYTIAMILVKEDDLGTEPPIYYLSRNLNDIEIRYSHVEKFSLVVV